MKHRFNVLLTEENQQKLMNRMNYLGSNRSNMILLNIFLYQDLELTETQIATQLEKIDKDSNSNKFYFLAMPYIVNIIKHKRNYLCSIERFVTAFLNEIIEKHMTNWEEADQLQSKITCIYQIDVDLSKWLENLSNETGVSQTTLLNFSFMNNIPFDTRISKEANKKSKGVYLTQASLDKVNKEQKKNRSAFVENHIRGLKKIVG